VCGFGHTRRKNVPAALVAGGAAHDLTLSAGKGARPVKEGDTKVTSKAETSGGKALKLGLVGHGG